MRNIAGIIDGMKSHKFSIGRASIGGGRGGRGEKRERGGGEGKKRKKKLFNPRYGYLSEVDGINWGEAADTFKLGHIRIASID